MTDDMQDQNPEHTADAPVATNRLNAGEVEVELDGTKRVLRCTLGAAQALSDRYGGLGKPWDLINAFNFDAYVLVTAAGLGVAKPDSAFSETVFRTGIVKLKDPLIRWLGMLANGGKPLRPEPEMDPKEAAGSVH